MPPCRVIEITLPDGSVSKQKVMERAVLWRLDDDKGTAILFPNPPFEYYINSVPNVGRRSKWERVPIRCDFQPVFSGDFSSLYLVRTILI
jgi:hypothetical protein